MTPMPSSIGAAQPRSWYENVNADCYLIPQKSVRTAWTYRQGGRVRAAYSPLNGHLKTPGMLSVKDFDMALPASPVIPFRSRQHR